MSVSVNAAIGKCSKLPTVGGNGADGHQHFSAFLPSLLIQQCAQLPTSKNNRVTEQPEVMHQKCCSLCGRVEGFTVHQQGEQVTANHSPF